MRKNFPITELCEALGVSRSGYHNLGKREPSRRRRANEQLLHQIRIIHSDRHTRCYGSPRMTRELRALGIGCSENRVARIMRSKDLRACPRRPFRPKTTQPDHAAHPSPNLLSEAGSPSAPGAQLVSDITYIPTREGWLYLAVVIDLFSRAILGWKTRLPLCTPIWSSVPPHAPSSQASCPREQSFTPIAAANTRPPSPASCSPDMVCAKA